MNASKPPAYTHGPIGEHSFGNKVLVELHHRPAGSWFASSSLALDWGLCGLVVLAGGLIRWLYLTVQSLWIDESASYLFSAYSLHDLFKNVLERDTHPPLYYLIVHFVYFYGGLSPIYALRTPSLICGILTIAIMYALGKRLVGRFTAVMAAAMTAFSPIAFWYSQDGRMYALTWCCVLLSYLLLVVAIQRPRWYWIAGYGIAVALALYADISSLLSILPELAIIAGGLIIAARAAQAMHTPETLERVRDWLKTGIGYVIGWLLFVPWLLALPEQLALIHATSFGAPTLDQFWLLALNDLGLSANYAWVGPTIPAVFATLLLLATGAAIVIVARAARLSHYHLYAGVVAALTLGCAAVFAVLVLSGSRAVLIPRVVGIVAFGFILLASGAVGILIQGMAHGLGEQLQELATFRKTMWALPSPIVRGGMLLGVEVFMLIFVGSGYASFTTVATKGFNGAQWNVVADKITDEAQPNDMVIYYPLGIKYIVDPYFPDKSPWRVKAKGLWPQVGHSPEPFFDANIPGHTHIWFLFYASSEVNMPLYDAWIREMGYCRQDGDPTIKQGYVEYGKCGP